MSPSRWQQVEALYHAVLDRAPEHRTAFLNQACVGDEELLREVESLVAQGDSSLLDRSQYEGMNSLPDAGSFQFTPGTWLGPYQVETRLGAGGMGEVFRATDTRLGRQVAIKTSKEQFSERFEREARAIAALNHQNICQVYDVGPNYLVMELIDGEPLKGPLPLDQVLKYAAQICDALDAAHRKGITHRDLKPSNVLVTKQGVKLLDFGLAKQTARPNGTDEILTESLTSKGQIVGTPQYMAPEQLQGKYADARSDLFAFGCVLYELITGKRAFGWKTNTTMDSSGLERKPTPTGIPRELDRVITKCLAEDPDERFQTARDLKTALAWAIGGQPVSAPELNWRQWAALAAAALMLAAMGVVWRVLRSRQVALGDQVVRFQITPPERSGFDPSSLAVSPDGRVLVYAATVKGKRELWVRPLESTRSRPLAGTEGATGPFWSPDNKSIGYFAGPKLWRIDYSGGPPLAICNVPNALRSGTWGANGMIVFSAFPGRLSQVSASGGSPVPLTTNSTSHLGTGHLWPQLLPGGRALLFFVAAVKPEESGVYVMGLEPPREPVRMVATAANALFAAGHLLWQRGSTLVAQRFDQDRLQLIGEPQPVTDPVGGGILGQTPVAASAGGVLIYATSGATQQLAWFDSAGKSLGRLRPAGAYYAFALSQDGRRVVVSKRSDSDFNLWMVDVERDVWSRLTFSAGVAYPLWSPDGRTILFRSGMAMNLFRKASGGEDAEERVTESANPQVATDWSRDGRSLLYYELAKDTDRDIWVLPVTPDGKPELGAKPRLFLRSSFNERFGRFSPQPNPRWVAYDSDETGKYEVYVQTYPEPKGKSLISTAGGQYPAWSADGRQLFYVSADSRLMAVQLKFNAESVHPSAPRALFDLPDDGSTTGSSPFAVAPDGQRFLVRVPADTGVEPLEVILNWPALLKKSPAEH